MGGWMVIDGGMDEGQNENIKCFPSLEQPTTENAIDSKPIVMKNRHSQQVLDNKHILSCSIGG
jgi:hypothetical protein